MIPCGWCGQPAKPDRCGNCHRDPALPWVQRGQEPPDVDPLDETRRRLAAASAALTERGMRATTERLAEEMDVSPRTVRRWQQMTAP